MNKIELIRERSNWVTLSDWSGIESNKGLNKWGLKWECKELGVVIQIKKIRNINT